MKKMNFVISAAVLMIVSWIIIYFPQNQTDLTMLHTFAQWHSHILTQFAIVMANLGGLPGTLCVVGILVCYKCAKQQYVDALFYGFGMFFTVMFAWGLKYLFARPRPVIEMPLVDTYGSSFPSAHSAYAMMLCCMLMMTFRWRQYPWVWSFAMVWALLMGCSRMYLGAHYLTDVVAGWSLAILTMLLVGLGVEYFGLKRQNFVIKR